VTGHRALLLCVVLLLHGLLHRATGNGGTAGEHEKRDEHSTEHPQPATHPTTRQACGGIRLSYHRSGHAGTPSPAGVAGAAGLRHPDARPGPPVGTNRDEVGAGATIPAMSAKESIETITRVRDDQARTPGEIRRLVESYLAEETSEAQMAAFLMAVNCRGLTDPETRELTDVMVNSGRRLEFPGMRGVVDKHSTGGIGDKTSLLLAPMLAAVGAKIPMLSGRGLGHTGGTLDKLESIPGFRVDLTEAEIHDALRGPGAVIAAATTDLAPADRRMYALRDATATVPSIPLIAASIMSKKIAEGTEALVLDVKHGSGAFITDPGQARRLAATMVSIGNASGVRTRALLTSMEQPLGRMVGNALEIREILETLAGGGPADLRELTMALAREMAELAGITTDPAETLGDGRAMTKWREMVTYQGGDPDTALPVAPVHAELRADHDGTLVKVDALGVGLAAWRLGAGRSRPGERIDHSVGVELCYQYGEPVRQGAVVAVVHAATETSAEQALAELREAIVVGTGTAAPVPLITGLILQSETNR
jgi:thymidine phosphorylase